MKNAIIICGLPRSGTTYVHTLISNNFNNVLSWPEESHILDDVSALNEFVDFHSGYFDKYLLQDPTNGYSPYGIKDEYIANILYMWLASHNAINFRDSFGDTFEYNINLHKKFLSRSLFQLVESNTFVIKKPTSELNHSTVANIFSPFRLFYVYCLRDPHDVFVSVVSRLKWFDVNYFIDVTIKSYNCFFDLFRSDPSRLLLFDMRYAGKLDYINDFCSRLSVVSNEEYVNLSSAVGKVNSALHLTSPLYNFDDKAIGQFLVHPRYEEIICLYSKISGCFENC